MDRHNYNDMYHCGLDFVILMNIFSFLPYNDLLILINRFKVNVKHIKRIYPNFNCPILQPLLLTAKQTDLFFDLEDDGPWTPDQFYLKAKTYIEIPKIRAIGINTSFNTTDFGCPMANYEYNFLEATNLKFLKIDNVIPHNIKVTTVNLTHLELMNIPHGYRDRRRIYYEFVPTLYLPLFEQIPNLKNLRLDYIPHQNLSKVSNYLETLTIEGHETDNHTLSNFILLHSNSLKRLRLLIDGKQALNVLLALIMEEAIFPNIYNLVFKLSSFTHMTHTNFISLAMLNKNNFPNLNYVTFSLNADMNNLQLLIGEKLAQSQNLD